MTPQELIDKITTEFADKGQLIEGGWRAFEITSLQNASPIQKAEMRRAYFLGAQHLWASMIGILEPDAEPTEKDLKRMDLIDKELRAFIDTIKKPTTN